jgi:hypothetical protein
MKRSYEDNYTLLNKLYKKEQNDLLTNRVKNAKSIISNHCPNSFNNFRKKANRSHEKKDLSKKRYII